MNQRRFLSLWLWFAPALALFPAFASEPGRNITSLAPVDLSEPPATCSGQRLGLDDDRCRQAIGSAFDRRGTAGSRGGVAPTAEDNTYWQTNLFKRVWKDQAFLVQHWWPAEARRPGFTAPLLVSLAGAAGSADHGPDYRVQRAVEGWSTGSRREVAQAFSDLGDSEVAVVVVGAGYLISRWTGHRRMSRATSLSAEAMINAAIYSTFLKQLTRRTRPVNGNTGQFFIPRAEPGQELTSFPSGHAMGAFAVAGVFASEYRDRRWVPWVAYGTASLIALSRVQLGRHYPSDVIAGAVLGRSLGQMVAQRSDGEQRLEPTWNLQPLFDTKRQGLGVNFTYSW